MASRELSMGVLLSSYVHFFSLIDYQHCPEILRSDSGPALRTSYRTRHMNFARLTTSFADSTEATMMKFSSSDGYFSSRIWVVQRSPQTAPTWC